MNATNEVYLWLTTFGEHKGGADLASLDSPEEFRREVLTLADADRGLGGGPLQSDIDKTDWPCLQERVRSDIRLNGVNGATFLVEALGSDPCRKCGQGGSRHVADPATGEWRIQCPK